MCFISSNRTTTAIRELDRVLGGGIVAGSLVLVGGDPGIGKSTLLLQMCYNLSKARKKVLVRQVILAFMNLSGYLIPTL